MLNNYQDLPSLTNFFRDSKKLSFFALMGICFLLASSFNSYLIHSYILPTLQQIIFVNTVNSFLPRNIVFVVVIIIFLFFTADTLRSLLSSTFLMLFCFMDSVKPNGSFFQPINLLIHKFHNNKYFFLKFHLFFLLPLFYLYGIFFYLLTFLFSYFSIIFFGT